MTGYLDQTVFDSMCAIGTPEDGFVADLYRVFVEQSALILSEMAAAKQSNDLIVVKRLAHRLKGSAANLGASELSKKAAAMEKQIDPSESTESQISADLSELSSIFAATKSEIDLALKRCGATTVN